jgi:K(+)-stimulated pyrophosphate-energized sodium pump
MIYLPIIISLISLIFAYYLVIWLRKCDTGTDKMRQIAGAIKKGADAFLKRQYKTIGIMALVLAVVLFLVYAIKGEWIYGIQTAFAFILGAFCSALSGFIGMWISVRANVRTAAAAEKGLPNALKVALRAGAASGISIVAISLIGLSSLYLMYNFFGYQAAKIPSLIIGFGFVGKATYLLNNKDINIEEMSK